MSRGGSSGGGRSSLGYLFEPEDITWIHTTKSKQETEKAPENIRVLQDDKIEMIKEEADQEPYPAPPKKEDSNPIVSHRPASNIYHTNQLGKNSGLLITPPRKAHPRGSVALRTPRHGRRTLRGRYDELHRQEPPPRGGGRSPPDASVSFWSPTSVLPAHADPAPAPARDRDVLRSAGHGDGASAGTGSGDGSGAFSFAGGRGGGRGGAAHRGAEGAEAVREADLPGGRRLVQPRHHVHGRRRCVLPFHLATRGRRGTSDGDVRHVRALRRRGGWDGVLGAVGAPGAVARVPVANARVAPPAPRRPVRAQRRVRHHQRRAGHLPPRLRLLPPRPPPRPLLRRGPRDYAIRHSLHVRPRRPGPPSLPRRPHRECALLPASGCGSQDTPHGQVRGRAVWFVPGTQGAGGGWWPGRAGEGARENEPEPERLMTWTHAPEDFCWFWSLNSFDCRSVQNQKAILTVWCRSTPLFGCTWRGGCKAFVPRSTVVCHGLFLPSLRHVQHTSGGNVARPAPLPRSYG